MSKDTPTFRLGIAMAGAVSAGAYTAGVMDYLLETLQKWQEAKDKNRALGSDHSEYDHSVPMHDVIIDTMGGASAGGMTAAIALIALYDKINLHEGALDRKKLYDAWVNLNDLENSPTLHQMLGSDDIQEHEKILSLLNSSPIDAIADRAGRIDPGSLDELPPYVSKDLEIILTITSLTGVPIAVNFFDSKKTTQEQGSALPAHKMYMHKGIAHFKLQNGHDVPPYTIGFDVRNESHRQLLMTCAKATGAFPIGLRARDLQHIPGDYVRASILRMFGLAPDAHGQGIDIITPKSNMNVTAVDGGTINNEPFDEIIKTLEDNATTKDQDYAVIMIDPFPNFDEQVDEEQKPSTGGDIIALIPRIIGAIRGQAMVKESEVVKSLSAKNYTRKMVFPKREGDRYPIACGSLGGFGGFFSRKFRAHDFELGRRNCQRFLRKHLSVPLEKAKEMDIFQEWVNKEQDPRFRRFQIEKDGQLFLPIVPDMGIELMSRGLFYEDYMEEPGKPKLDVQEILALDPLIRQRTRDVIVHLMKPSGTAEPTEKSKASDKISSLLDRHYPSSWWGRQFNKLAMWAFRKFGIPSISKTASRSVVSAVLRDFEKRDLLRW